MVGIIGARSAEEGERDLSLLDWSLLRDISPDGKLILFDESGEGGGAVHAVYVRRTDGSPAVRLGEGVGGSFALYGFRRGELPGHLFRLDLANGNREVRRELRPRDPSGVVEIVSVVATPDGSSYAYSQQRILSDLFLVAGLR
jgi:hypothetical protein